MNDDPKQPLRLRELAQSLAAAALGVQSARNRARDFSRGRAWQFIVLGVLATLLFVLLLLGLVQIIVHLA